MSSIKGRTICFTGTLVTKTRAAASKEAKAHGAAVSGSVTKKVDLLVAGPGAGAKLKQAEDKGIEVWTEEQFNEAIGAASEAPATPSKRKKAPAAAAAKSPPAKKAKTAAKTPSPKKPATKKMAPATPAAASGGRRVMSAIPDGQNYSVYGDHDVKLMLSDSLNANSNKFYKLQLLTETSTGNFYVATNWGRLGEPGRSQLKGPHSDEEKAIDAFAKQFRAKTKNDWGTPFVRHEGKYQIVETMQGEEDGDDDAALGRLTESQIHKGQGVLKQLREALGTAAKAKRPNKSKLNTELGVLSNEFYSLIPTTSGRQRPPPLNNLDIITEKEGLLEFWLRMGFDEVTDCDTSGSPIEGMFDLPVPSTLSAAASSISDKHSIKSSRDRGTELSKQKAGTPVKKMSPELYASILLYTGNSIYRELNRCLRTEWRSVKKYWNYLRLYFEAMECMPQREVTLWRGIAADLYDEYEEGKIITWWSISSCTASKDVAQNFMNQLGGSAATLLQLHTKTACDVSSLSFYPHEQESLLKPGTKLRVLKRKRKGKVIEIEVEEVVE